MNSWLFGQADGAGDDRAGDTQDMQRVLAALPALARATDAGGVLDLLPTHSSPHTAAVDESRTQLLRGPAVVETQTTDSAPVPTISNATPAGDIAFDGLAPAPAAMHTGHLAVPTGQLTTPFAGMLESSSPGRVVICEHRPDGAPFAVALAVRTVGDAASGVVVDMGRPSVVDGTSDAGDPPSAAGNAAPGDAGAAAAAQTAGDAAFGPVVDAASTTGGATPSAGGAEPTAQQDTTLIRLDQFRADPRFAGIDGSGVTVVVIDTGIDLNHSFFGPDADANGIADRIVVSYDFYGSNDSNASDFNGHGSNVASIIGSQDATYTGMAPGCNIIALKVFPDGSGLAPTSDIQEALGWVVANRAALNIVAVNMSLGYGDNLNAPTNSPFAGSIATLAANNCAVVVSSGNSYEDYQAQGVATPSADPNAWSVGAVWDRNAGGPYNWSSGAVDYTTGADRITSFSQRTATMSTIFAPGGQITGAYWDGGLSTYSGTSQAAPHIAGLVADMQELALQVSGKLMSVADLESTMISSSVSIVDGDDENDNVANTGQTYHRVDAYAWGVAVLNQLFAGTAGVDTLTGTAVGDVIHGQGGNDVISGADGNDTLYGDAGTDSLLGVAGNDTLYGGSGTDAIDGGGGADVIVGGTGDATLAVVSSTLSAGYMGTGWTQRDVGDFTGDGKADILWSSTAGRAAIWVMSGASVIGFGLPAGQMGAEWTMRAAGDFNGDSRADIAWQSAGGHVAIWVMSGTMLTGFGVTAGSMGSEWTMRDARDFNGDGKADILWSSTSGRAAIWTMDGTTLAGFAVTAGMMGAEWTMHGAADFGGDGKADILWSNAQGRLAIWSMDGTTLGGFGVTAQVMGAGWSVAGFADFNGDGRGDVLWSSTAGTTCAWLMSGSNVIGTLFPSGSMAPPWHLNGVADFTGDGVADALWNQGGQVTEWNLGLMGANTLTGGSGGDRFVLDGTLGTQDIIADFQAGPGGDQIDVDAVLSTLGYGGSDPIGDGVVHLVQDGANTDVQARSVASDVYVTIAILQSTTASAITPDNIVT